MASSRSRANASAGSRKGKSGKKAPVRPKSGTGVPLLPIVVGSILGVLVIVMIGLIIYYGRPQPTPTPNVAGIPCDHLEHSQVHYHAGLQIVYHGSVTNLPAAGIQTDSAGTVTCYYWLHVHASSPNVIHIESPATDKFTLGQFFAVWNQWSKSNGFGAQRLDASHVAQFTLQPGEKIVVYVDLGDGKGPQPYTGDPSAIQLKQHEVITLEITPPDVNPPPAFTFPSGL
jgi:hypothetical protein